MHVSDEIVVIVVHLRISFSSHAVLGVLLLDEAQYLPGLRAALVLLEGLATQVLCEVDLTLLQTERQRDPYSGYIH
jgi:hypothetical protein